MTKKDNKFKIAKIEDLFQDLSKERTALREFHFAVSGAKAKTTQAPKTHKRNIARILTEIKARQNSENK